MFRKSFSMLNLVIIFTLLASLSGAASAAPASFDEPSAPTYPPGYHPPVVEPLAIQGRLTASQSPAAPQQGDGKVRAQAAVLGKPGTLFAYQATMGTTETPFYSDPDHLYTPVAMTFDTSGNFYAIEETSGRLLKYNASDGFEWGAGKAGVHDWGKYDLNWPKDVAATPDGSYVWVADNDIATQFDAATGKMLQHFPADPKNQSDDNYRFNNLYGVAFDSQNHLYLADMSRGRVQVFTTSGSSVPVYYATIWGFNSAAQMAVGANDVLYVNDPQNATVKKCTPDKSGGTWTWDGCPVYIGESGVWANSETDTLHLNNAAGLGLDSVHNVLYISDSKFGRVLRCTTAATCTMILQIHFGWLSDVEVKPGDGHIIVSEWNRNWARDYGTDPQVGDSGTLFHGDANIEPYATDDLSDKTNMHFNQPTGVEIDKAGNMYLLEESGNRLIKLGPDGSKLWVFGAPGYPDPSNPTKQLDYPRALALDNRNILIVGGSYNYLRSYNALTGKLMDTLDGGYGKGDYEFQDIYGLATDSANNIYVSDAGTNQVKMFSYNPASTTQKFKLLRTFNPTGSCGQSNSQFCNPRGLTVDAARNLYVADANNCRVQKFDSKGAYKMTFGSGVCGDSLSRLGGPTDVAVDAQGRVYVAEEWNSRVQVFDKTGAYLTTIAGTYDSASGALRSPRAVTLDKLGNVYVADWSNSRVQKFAPSVPYWTQVNLDGFGYRQVTHIMALTTFKNILYAGGTDQNNQATIWKMVGTTWTPVMNDGFEDGSNQAIDHLLEYKGYLYATTIHGKGGQMWRSPDGLSWQMVVMNGFNDPSNVELFRLAVLNNKLCVSTWDYGSAGTQLWCSTTGEIGTWNQDGTNGLGDSNNSVILSMLDYKNSLGTTASFATTLHTTTAQVWRRVSGNSNWVQLTTPWPTDGRYNMAGALTAYQNYLYVFVRTQHVDGQADIGASIYRCQVCDGSDWSAVASNGLGNSNSYRGYALEATTNGLYAFAGNLADGLDIWWSKTGASGTWTRPFAYGLGSNNNTITYWDNATLFWGGKLYVGLFNNINGTEIWKMCPTTKVCK